jgi:fumarate reductase flavoprotein subunit
VKVDYTDVLVVGGGLAGLRIALAAKRRGHDTVILSLVPPKRSHSAAAQGGMQASLGNVIKGSGDNEDVHFQDTVRGSDWGADQEVVRMFVDTAPKAVRELAAWGVPWTRISKGEREVVINGKKVIISEREQADGLLNQRNFGGTSKWRTCYASAGTGHAMRSATRRSPRVFRCTSASKRSRSFMTLVAAAEPLCAISSAAPFRPASLRRP